ncbi:Multimeric flavodoxin WrbA [Sporobacter termitidis DSM 10068]|uniref:Multimeric flavodoxin WrbA n=1 Tax=Sporobacter termitidis DSM 10068 TaxID=1123282 RepID=A0A1M5WKY3_9FIRM|nr:flavodoxin family protein [Sporobacter termitidis]SHH88185.1 Multimeric flavodoxin WrbA [Sporobacter termitidis DSM 10068]
MKAIAVNGSPRRKWNTAQMLESALSGCRDAGAETELVHLIDLKFKGCTSCFGCKRLGGPSYAKCAMRDDLTRVLDDVWDADVLIVGSPVYFGDVTADVRAFLERLWFSILMYNKEHTVRAPKSMPVKIILTTNAPEFGFHKSLNEGLIGTMSRFIGPAELIEANATLQFDDYGKYDAGMFDVDDRIKRHNEVFPQDCRRAYEMGKRAVAEAKELK